jgi:hypothetical protein
MKALLAILVCLGVFAVLIWFMNSHTIWYTEGGTVLEKHMYYEHRSGITDYKAIIRYDGGDVDGVDLTVEQYSEYKDGAHYYYRRSRWEW